MDEWIKYGGRLHPGALKNYNNLMEKISFEKWLQWIENDRYEKTCPEGAVPQDLYFLVNINNRIFGAITIRHYLNEKFQLNGGHFGVGIRPSERQKGYGSKIIQLGLKIAKINYKINKIIYTCDYDNIGSIKAFEKNGGIFLDEIIIENDRRISRYKLDI